jgi:hypothetical protein
MTQEAAPMKAKSDTQRPAGLNSRGLLFARALFVVILAVLVYLLGLSMVHHRFFRGGRINQHGRLVP